MMNAESYLAGVVAADGHLEQKPSSPTIASAYKEFIDYIETVAQIGGYRASYFWDEQACVYKIRIQNKQFWEVLTSKYSIPAGKKAETIRPPIRLPETETLWCIKGWFDGEGWPEQMIKHEAARDYTYPRVGFKISSREIRDWIVIFLRKKGIRTTVYNRKDGTFGLWINGYAEREKFRELIGFEHPEQKRKLDELLRLKTTSP